MALLGLASVAARITSNFLADPRWISILLLLRNPKKQISNVNYYSAEIADEKAIRTLLAEIRPKMSINSAALQYYASTKELERSIVKGSENMFRCVSNGSSFKAFV